MLNFIFTRLESVFLSPDVYFFNCRMHFPHKSVVNSQKLARSHDAGHLWIPSTFASLSLLISDEPNYLFIGHGGVGIRGK